MYGTWTDSHSDRLWLRDFLPQDASRAHVMSFGYNSGVAFSGSVSGIDDFAISLLRNLMMRRRRAKTEHNPLIFVCHSLGGIVFKKVVLAEQRRQNSAIFADYKRLSSLPTSDKLISAGFSHS
jgi:hypothetical protein